MEQLDTAWQEYCDKVEALALEVFNGTIKPWLDQHGYRFRADVNWGWSVKEQGEADNDDPISEDRIPAYIMAALSTEIPGMPTTDLGSFMPAYK